MNKPALHVALLLLLAVVVLFTNLGGPRLWDRDEPRNAGCAAEMLARGDWVVPVFNAEIRTHKPVLLYWFMMASYALLGVNEFSARLPSALLAVGTVLCTYLVGRRLFSPAAALWAAAILTTALMFNIAARAATPDSTLIFFATAALTAYVLTTFREPRGEGENATLRAPGRWFPENRLSILAIYACTALAMLAKGPVGVVLPCAVIGMFLLIVRLPARSDAEPPRGWLARLRRICFNCLRTFHPLHFLKTCGAMRLDLALLAIALIALPWYAWVSLRSEGEWTLGFFFEHNFGRATTAMEGHGGGFYYYPLAILAGFMPWSVFLPGALEQGARRMRTAAELHPGRLLAYCWIGVYVILFSLAKTKLPSYVTPCYPALALLTGDLLHGLATGRVPWPAWGRRVSLAVPIVLGIGLLIGIPLAASRYLPGDGWLGLVGLVPLIGGVACLVLSELGRTRQCLLAYGGMAALMCTAMFGGVAWRVDRHQHNDELLAAIEEQSANPHVASYGVLEPTWVFYGGRPIREFPPERAAAAMEFLIEPEHYAIVQRHDYERLLGELPAEVEVLAESPYFMKKSTLVLLGRRNPAAQTARREGSAGERR